MTTQRPISKTRRDALQRAAETLTPIRGEYVERAFTAMRLVLTAEEANLFSNYMISFSGLAREEASEDNKRFSCTHEFAPWERSKQYKDVELRECALCGQYEGRPAPLPGTLNL